MRKLYILVFAVLIFISCKVDVTNDNDSKNEVKPTNYIYEFYAKGMDSSVYVSWFPISSDYDVFLSYCDAEQTQENVVKINPGQTSFTLSDLTNATKDLSLFYEFTLTVKDKNGEDLILSVKSLKVCDSIPVSAEKLKITNIHKAINISITILILLFIFYNKYIMLMGICQ